MYTFAAMQEVSLYGKTFEPYLTAENIEAAVQDMAHQINKDFKDQSVTIVAVLNGAFMFCADLVKKIDVTCAVSFVKLQSYQGTESTGVVNELIGLGADLSGANVLLVEDIVDTGNTLEKLVDMFGDKDIASLKIATLLHKPSVYKKEIPIDYIGIKIPNEFVLGYGLDYDGLGRNLDSIYKLKK